MSANEVDARSPALVSPAAPSQTESSGRTAAEATRRLAEYGENALSEHHVSVFQRLAQFFWGPIPWMIEAAAMLSAVLGHWADLAIILTMLFINAGVGFWQEFKADNAIALLKQRLALKARVLRDGVWKDIEAKLLVPGDVVLVKLGNIVPADLKLIGGAYLSVDQAALTGESLPVDKKVGDDAYSGSIAKQGEMTGLVTATGMNTYFGKTAHLVEQAKTVSHFQRAVLRIGNFLILVTVGLVLVIGVAAVFRRDPLFETLQFALILTVASIPVALPAVLSAGDRRRTSRVIQGDRLASRRHRRDGGDGHPVQRQDRHPDQKRTDARGHRAGAERRTRRTHGGGGAGLAARRARRDRRGDPRPCSVRRILGRLRGEGLPTLRPRREARRGRHRTGRQTLQGRERRAASHHRPLRSKRGRTKGDRRIGRSRRGQGFSDAGGGAHGSIGQVALSWTAAAVRSAAR